MRSFTATSLLLLLALAHGAAAEGPPGDPWQVLELPMGLAERVEQEIGAVTPDPEARFEQLVDFMHHGGGVDFRYQATPTHDLASTYAGGEGNCLSFTLLFIGLARHLGLDARAREVRIRPSWENDSDLLKLITHVNVSVRMPGREAIVDFEPDLMNAMRLGSPFRGRVVSDQRALAHFHNNRAVEILGLGQLAEALAWIDQAVELDPEFVPAWNTRGVILRRQGEPALARASFEQALALDDDNPLAVTNLAALDPRESSPGRAWLASLPSSMDKAEALSGGSKFGAAEWNAKGDFKHPD